MRDAIEVECEILSWKIIATASLIGISLLDRPLSVMASGGLFYGGCAQRISPQGRSSMKQVPDEADRDEALLFGRDVNLHALGETTCIGM